MLRGNTVIFIKNVHKNLQICIFHKKVHSLVHNSGDNYPGL